jgi:hypothetical protein
VRDIYAYRGEKEGLDICKEELYEPAPEWHDPEGDARMKQNINCYSRLGSKECWQVNKLNQAKCWIIQATGLRCLTCALSTAS